MKIIEQSWRFMRDFDGEDVIKLIEECGRTCYKSEEKITPDSTRKFVKEKLIDNGHHAMLEFGMIPPVKIITNRGVTHEIVRHRLFSYAQESTRYCNYSKDRFGNEITFILSVWFTPIPIERQVKIEYYYKEGYTILTPEIFANNLERQYMVWLWGLNNSEYDYLRLIELGQTPQEARDVLPNSLKTEICVFGNAREWRHFFTLRTSPKAHPQMQDIAKQIYEGFKSKVPVLFDDIIKE